MQLDSHDSYFFFPLTSGNVILLSTHLKYLHCGLQDMFQDLLEGIFHFPISFFFFFFFLVLDKLFANGLLLMFQIVFYKTLL